ncbi:Atxe2 family lasso peptide isopeptidase [Sphingosinithalassobacter sp. CS137]|uniref:Atxe2 family lasso peptide isopeptidase n=1 Tax=Sphingosinithalassobacter sp. CS137 TaxID=2762748 RepID=UPI00165DBF61|nr:Atxe2 family lasso peptide isopeptidase [Sphingosinithalassobacter sp. CS137]
MVICSCAPHLARRRWWVMVPLAALIAPPAHAACNHWDPLGGAPGEARSLSAADLIELTGIGRAPAPAMGGPSPISVSPDGRRIAFVVQRADLAANRYCQALLRIDLDGASPPRVLDQGGDFIMSEVVMRGLSIPNGLPQQTVPAWSPDGRLIAYLRREDGVTRLWTVAAAGGRARPLTDEKADILAWRWMPGGGRIGFGIQPDRNHVEDAITAEGSSGWLYDERVTPNTGFRPNAKAALPVLYKTIDLKSGQVQAASAGEAKWIASASLGATAQAATLRAAKAWTMLSGSSPLGPKRLHVIDRAGQSQACTWSACTGHFVGLWWLRDGHHLVFLKREGWNERYTALYRWSPGRGAPERVLRTDAQLERCTPIDYRLLCIRETAAKPAHIVSIDPGRGRIATHFEPNPAFASIRLGSVERVTWRNANGFEVYGDLVLPPDFQPGVPLPTIVVLYRSRGFLHGGTGNEYPIYLFAQRGFAVLSIERPDFFGARRPDLDSYRDIEAANIEDWSERRNMHSAIEAGVELLVARGIADPTRLGITGLSDGATSARFALINADLFAAAAISSCCIDESSAVLVGPAWERYSQSVGYPPAFPVDEAFWQPVSFVLNASKIDTPLLMQLADSESLYALPSVTALRQHRQPVEVRVFPDEFHIKWQPVHRAAVFETSLDWFDFWLNGKTDPAPAKAAQYRRWRALGQGARRQLHQLSDQERSHASTSAKSITRPQS